MNKITESQAISKLKKVEVIFKELKKSGYNVYCEDNETIVMESPKDKKSNEDIMEKEHTRVQKSRGIGYGIHFAPKLKHIYSFPL